MRSAPTVEALEKLICRTYEALSYADERRLNAIELRLRERYIPQRRAVPRIAWILGAFFAVSAAAWWTGNTLFSREEKAPAQTIKMPPAEIDKGTEQAPPKDVKKEGRADGENVPKTDAAPKIIYRHAP